MTQDTIPYVHLIERQIVTLLADTILQAGYLIEIDNGGGDDEIALAPTAERSAVMEALFAHVRAERGTLLGNGRDGTFALLRLLVWLQEDSPTGMQERNFVIPAIGDYPRQASERVIVDAH